jgi:hypothetical protein
MSKIDTRKCSEPGCNGVAVGRGLCMRHYQSRKRSGTLPPLALHKQDDSQVRYRLSEAGLRYARKLGL